MEKFTDSGAYEVRECHGHYHVTCGGMDLIGGKFEDKEQAEQAKNRLNNGEDIDEVFPQSFGNMFRSFLESVIPEEEENEA